MEWLRQMLGLTAAVWLSLGVAIPGVAQPGGMATDEGLEISGLMLDETKTKIGRDFYEYFNTHWQEIKGINYTITITELPSAIRGSIMRIKWNDEVIYQAILNPRPGQVEKTAKQAVLEVQVYVLKQLTTQQQLEEEFQY